MVKSKPYVRWISILLLGAIFLSVFAVFLKGRNQPEVQTKLPPKAVEPTSAQPRIAEAIIPDTGTDAGMVQVGRYETLELVFFAQSTPDNPFKTYLLRVELTDPDGKKLTIDGFYDGDGNGGQDGKVWKARIAPYQTGVWRWRTVQGDRADVGLANQSGQFEVVESSNPGGIVASGKHFRFQNGDFIYLAGNFLDFSNGLRTTHTYMSETTSDSQRSAIMARQRDFHAANKANLYFANKGDYDNQAVTPWLGTAKSNDKSRMDLSRWKKYDRYIQDFRSNRMLAEMWFFADDSGFGGISMDQKKILARYAMARTSAFSHTMYVIALEYQEGWSPSSVGELGNYIQKYNPWQRPVSVHGITLSDWAFSGDGWVDFIASQAGNDSDMAVVNRYTRDFFSQENIPHLGEEFGILNNNSDDELRGRMWANLTGGAAGGGTGSDLKAMQRFLAQSRAPFQRMSPANQLVDNGGSSRFVLAEGGHHYLVYSNSGPFSLDVQGGGLKGYWFNPRDPNGSLSGGFNVGSGRQTFNPPSDAGRDWVLWVTDGSNLNSGANYLSGGDAVKSIRIGAPAPAGKYRTYVPVTVQ